MSHDSGKQGFAGTEDRLKKSVDAGRAPRAAADAPRTNEDGLAFTAEERRAMLRQEWVQEALPKLPEIVGYHICWLSTTNSYDPIHKRVRMGYTPVKAEEVPGFEAFRMKGAEWDGVIGCNEMVAFKIPNELYQDIMAMLHHDMPLEEEKSIKEQALAMLGKDRRKVEDRSEEGSVEDTLEYLGRTTRTPIFTP